MVHHLERSRHDPGGDDVTDGLGGVAHGRERQQQGAHRRWVRRQADGDFGGDSECAFTADERASQIEPGRLVLQPSEFSDLPVGQDDLDGQNMGVRDAVGEAVGASRIVGDIAAERADLLA